MRVHWQIGHRTISLASVRIYTSGDKPRSSDRVVRTIFKSCERLVDSPQRERIGKKRGTRELVFAPLPYIAVYRVRGSVIEILSV
jgi:plasmid stabilization system protein ParE